MIGAAGSVSNKNVELAGQHQGKLLVPWSQLDTDTTYLSNEVGLYLLLENRVE
jgi:hypothetical protein